ncbi:hypothetical protein WA026_017672 [Henosepilachna vigintioctopunctata]|uniref:Uncharacterized protein n=1 Tax=Henosepilachna vigintioctopunctata TaxID=420089 RepID=A0AAW1UB62_9CUCU
MATTVANEQDKTASPVTNTNASIRKALEKYIFNANNKINRPSIILDFFRQSEKLHMEALRNIAHLEGHLAERNTKTDMPAPRTYVSVASSVPISARSTGYTFSEAAKAHCDLS